MSLPDLAVVQQQMTKYGVGTLFSATDPLMEVYHQIGANYITNKTPKHTLEFLMACMMARTVLYYHKSPGDCGSPSQQGASLGTEVGKFGQLGASTAGVGISAAATFGGLSAATAAEAGTVVGLVALPFTVLGIFAAHHAAAVQKEQAVLCSASVQANALLSNIDNAVASGQMTVDTALTTLKQLVNNADGFISQVRQDCNAGCVISKAIHALVDLRTFLYKQAKSQGPAAVQSTANSLTSTGNLAYAGVAALAATAAGVI